MGNSDSHAVFIDGVHRLVEEEINASDNEFWTSMFSVSTSVEDVFAIMSPDLIRRIREKHPHNLQVFLTAIVNAMRDVADAAEAHETNSLTAEETAVAVTTVRMLTRLVPLLLEDGELGIVQDILWKPGGLDPPAPQVAGEDQEGAKTEAETSPGEEAAEENPCEVARRRAAAEKQAAEEANAAQSTLGNRLLDILGRFLFLPGFTVKPRTKLVPGPHPTYRVDERTVWKGGIGVSSAILNMPDQAFLKNRLEVLRCVLACLSGPLFQNPDDYQESPPTMLVRFCSGEVPYTANLFCSLMAAVFSYDPVGWGLPYGGLFRGELESELVDLASQILCIVLDLEVSGAREDSASTLEEYMKDSYAGGAEAGEDDNDDENAVDAAGMLKEWRVDNSVLQAETHGLGFRHSCTLQDLDTTRTAIWGSKVVGTQLNDTWLEVEGGGFLPMVIRGTPVIVPFKAQVDSKPQPRNIFRFLLRHVDRDAEIDLIYAGIVRMLNTVHEATQTYLPSSKKGVGFYQEALVLLWHLLTINKTFTQRVTNHLDTNQILMPVLYLLQTAHGHLHMIGLLHSASFILLVLSAERAFSVRLNEAYSGNVPLSIPAFQGTYADVMTLTIHRVVSDSLGRPGNDALVEMLLTALSNISPYVKSYALETCLKLLSLIERCARPSILWRTASSHNGLMFMVELINNVIQYQFEGNSMLVYSILRQKEVFQRLSALKLPAPSRGDQPSSTPPAAPPSEEISTQDGEEVGEDESSRFLPPPAQDKDTATASATATATGSGDREGQGDGDGERDGDRDGDREEAPTPASAFTAKAAPAWMPDEDTLLTVKKKLPLQAVMCMINYLQPKIEGMLMEGDVSDQAAVLKYLKNTTMVGVLPVPHPIVIRTYQASPYTSMWFTSYVWGVIFTRSQRMPLYDWKKIKLVVINN